MTALPSLEPKIQILRATTLTFKLDEAVRFSRKKPAKSKALFQAQGYIHVQYAGTDAISPLEEVAGDAEIGREWSFDTWTGVILLRNWLSNWLKRNPFVGRM